ncbi:DUF928 domain-containing protein [Leptolyngbya sp. AN02str]|uniref:DUF928 domain-containing protein n=1 Tax=Leptolyngbya sp. AN02str TaxID=3423363 RepID=UPI003D32102F
MKRSFLLQPLGTLVLLMALAGVSIRDAHAISFTPPDNNSAPSASTGGASRGTFIPPSGNEAPRQATGGASRGTFIPPSGNEAPQQATGGASRGTFVPPSNNTAPRQATGGASRDGFIPPSDNAAPQTAVGGASRTNLYGYLPSQSGEQAVSMLAVTPQTFYGTTLAERPTILVYVPASNAQDAVFSLKDEAGNTLYQTLVTVPSTAGIVAVQLPENAPALEIGQNYQWFFALMVDGTLSPSTPYVDAWIKRIAPDTNLAQALQQVDAHQQAETLAANGVWYDSVALLTDLRIAQPTNTAFTADWHELLNSVGLQEVTTVYAATVQ